MASDELSTMSSDELSTDALPLAPRSIVSASTHVEHQHQQRRPRRPRRRQQQRQQQQQQDTFERSSFAQTSNVPVDWAFNALLLQLSTRISKRELNKIKDLFRFEGGLGKKILGKIKSTSDLFTILRQQFYLRRENFDYLQSILWHLKRRDLIELVVEYAKENPETTQMYFVPEEQPATRYKYTKFHVCGKALETLDKDFIYSLRQKVSRLLCIPLRFVIIAGVEPSSSILITLMIPEMYADILEGLLKENASLKDLADLGIDRTYIGENDYSLNGNDGDNIAETEAQVEIVSVYQQLKENSKRLDEVEVQCLELRRKLSGKESVPDSTGSMSSQSTSVAIRTGCALQSAGEKSYDSHAVKRLITSS